MLANSLYKLLLVALCFQASPSLAAQQRPPNVILILADDLGYGDIGCYGNTRIRTPHLDRLAKEGIRLTDFHSSGAVCSPSRAGLLTGRYQQRAGIPGVIMADPSRPVHHHGLQDREITFAELFSQAGYQTALFGKWHLGYHPKYNPVRHGFGQFRGYVSGNVDFFSHVDQAGKLDWWRDDVIEDEPGYTTHLITKHSLAFIEANKNMPFCLYLPYEPPHYPYQGPNDSAIRTVGKPRGPGESRQSPAEVQRAYKEMVEEMDTGIGEIIAALKQHDLDQNTLVMFFSDNGATAQGSNGVLRGNKGQVWEGGHRVPFIAWWPGKIPPGRISNDLSITLDVMPTLLSAAGIEPPSNHQLDGINLLPHLTQGQPLGERKLFWAHGNSQAIRKGDWKAVVGAPGQKQPGLFNLSQDISEQNDLAKDNPDRLEEMLRSFKDWQKDVAKGATPQPNNAPEKKP
jgi:arylsulfatase A